MLQYVQPIGRSHVELPVGITLSLDMMKGKREFMWKQILFTYLQIIKIKATLSPGHLKRVVRWPPAASGRCSIAAGRIMVLPANKVRPRYHPGRRATLFGDPPYATHIKTLCCRSGCDDPVGACERYCCQEYEEISAAPDEEQGPEDQDHG
jgi:hypothetical protein